YSGFGSISSESSSTLGDRYYYSSRELDKLTGLQYNRQRYYDSSIGNWTTIDPLRFSQHDNNLYRYVGNQPLSKTDPSGLDSFWINGGNVQRDMTVKFVFTTDDEPSVVNQVLTENDEDKYANLFISYVSLYFSSNPYLIKPNIIKYMRNVNPYNVYTLT